MANKYYSEKIQGSKPRIIEDIPDNVWVGIVSLIRRKIDDGSFGSRFPLQCPDSPIPCGCNEEAFSTALKSEVPDVQWPLNSSEIPPVLVVLDMIEFCFKSAGKPKQIGYHNYFNHHHLNFNVEEGHSVFQEEINLIFSRNGIAYELDENGSTRRVGPPILQKALQISLFRTGDAELDELLEDARIKILDPNIKVRKEALEKIWDSWERIKTIEKRKDKKTSTKAILDKAASESKFRETLEKEATELTRIGNTFWIRHSETNQTSLEQEEHVDYLFHRLFALIRLVLRMSGRGG